MKNVIRKAFKSGLTIVLTAMLALPAMAQEDALKGYPGYVDFSSLGDIFGEPTVQISVGESLLGLVGALSASEDPEAGYDFVKDASNQLSSLGWESVVTVNSEDEQVRIFMKIADDMVQGITVMAVEPTEAVFVNVIGDLKPEELGQVMDNFDVDID